MFELFLVLKDRHIRDKLPTTLELELAQGLCSVQDPLAQAYFKNLAEQAEARARALKVCCLLFVSVISRYLTSSKAPV